MLISFSLIVTFLVGTLLLFQVYFMVVNVTMGNIVVICRIVYYRIKIIKGKAECAKTTLFCWNCEQSLSVLDRRVWAKLC